MSPLQLRKKFLIAESELNRAEMSRDLATVAAGVRALAERTRNFGSIASSAAGLVSGLAGFQRTQPAASATSPSWGRTLLKGAATISRLWLAFKPRRRDPSG
jgi:hypothetical protein